MSQRYLDRVKMTTATTGTGTMTLGTASSGFRSFATAGVANGDTVDYVIEDGTNWEVGVGTYSTTGPTLARTTIAASSNAGAAISLSGAATVYIGVTAALIARFFPSEAFITLTDAATVAWDGSLGFNAKVTLGGNRTLGAMTNPVEGRAYALQIIQPPSGGPWGLTFNAAYDFGGVGAPASISTAAGTIDMLYLICINATTPKFKATFSKGS